MYCVLIIFENIDFREMSFSTIQLNVLNVFDRFFELGEIIKLWMSDELYLNRIINMEKIKKNPTTCKM